MLKYLFYFVFITSMIVGIKGTNLSNTPGVSCSSYVSQHSVATDSRERVHVVWYDESDTAKAKSSYQKSFLIRAKEGEKQFGFTNIYYRRSTSLGATWDDTVNLTKFDSVYAGFPSVATNDEDIVHIVWNDDHTNMYQVYYIQSIDGGINWNPIIKLSNTTNPSEVATIATSGDSLVYVVWREAKDTVYTIWYSRSTDAGNSWSSAATLTEAGVCPFGEGISALPCPAIVASGNFVHLVWQDTVYGDTLSVILYKQSDNYGATWSTDTMLTPYNDLCSLWPTVAASDTIVYVIWVEQASVGDSAFYWNFKHSTDNGMTWGPAICITQDTIDILFGTPQVVAKDRIVAVVWCDYMSRIYFKASNDYGITWSADSLVDIGHMPSLAIDLEDNIHIVWTSDDFEIFHERFAFVGIEEEKPGEEVFFISQGYPNPFIDRTQIEYNLPRISNVNIAVYNVLGSKVKTLLNKRQNPGRYTITWDGRDERGNKLPVGFYFLRLETGEYEGTRKLLLIK